jgi:hypothetical protein
MSRSDGAAYPPVPFDHDARVIRGASHWEDDESILTPISDEQARALESALWPLLAGDVIQVPDPERAARYLAENEEMRREEEKEWRARQEAMEGNRRYREAMRLRRSGGAA